MKKRTIRDKRRIRKIRIVRVSILFITVVILITGIITLAEYICITPKGVNAAVAEQSKLSNVKVSENQQHNKSGQPVLLKNDSVTDDVASIEKYLLQEYKGVKPEESDEVKIAYLTFDDGPSETVTPKILDVLKENNVKATFFIVGQTLDKNNAVKEILKREVLEGHAIGNHTYSHNYKYLYPNRIVNAKNFMADIDKTNKSLQSVLGNDFYTKVIRFPGGHMSWKGMKSIDDVLASKDYHQVDWNVLSKDAEGKPKKASELVNNIIQTVKGKQKAVILMHDTYGKEETAKALPEIIKYLKEQGYEFRIMK